jgi:hypothetical protein
MPTDEGHALISELDADSGDQHREVYARFGVAVYYAQVFEAGIANLILISERMQGRHLSDSDVDSRFEALWRKTLGTLLALVRDGQLLGTDELDLCQDALATRNRLIHRFWRDEIEHTITPDGRQYLCDEVDAMRRLFIRADKAATEVMLRIGAPGGLTAEMIQEAMEKMKADVERRARAFGQV